MREITFQAALEEAVAEEMRRDPRVFTMATDFTGNPVAEFGPTRVRFSPISESVLTGMGLGAAGCGFRPIVNWRMVTWVMSWYWPSRMTKYIGTSSAHST